MNQLHYNKPISCKLPLVLLLVTLLNNGCFISKSIINCDYAASISASSKILDSAKNEVKTPAISIAVGINNEIVWAKAIGYKDQEKVELADVNTKFRVGSSSKAITSAALGKLIENGQLNLDSNIRHYVPFFDASKPSITIRQLASHSSGIRNYKNNEFNSNIEYKSIEESMKIFMYDSLLFQPGEKFGYTSYNYTVLSAAIEQITGTDFLNYMQKTVFNPLKMDNTTGDHQFKFISNKAEFYNYDAKENKFKKPAEVNNSNKWAAGGFLSTPTDLVKFGNAFLYNKILNKATTNIIWQPQRLNNGKINTTNYAIGWRADSVKLFNGSHNIRQVHHGGSASGSTSLLVLFPDYKMSVSILANRDFASADLFKYAHKIAEQFISQKKK